MKKPALSLAIWMLLSSPAVAGTMYIVGPNERGEGALPPATGITLVTLGLFFVDIYAEDMPGFAGFQATLEFLDETFVDAAGSTIYFAYNHLVPEPGAPWGDRQITWNQAFLPEILEVLTANSFGLMSTEREWLSLPVNDWGDFVDKPITEKTWLMTVGYWYMPGAEGHGSTTYTIKADRAATVFGDVNAREIPHVVITGSVTIGVPITHNFTVESTPPAGVTITGDKPGATPYTATCDDQQLVTLTAPATIDGGSGKAHNLLYWIVDGQPRAYGQNELQLTMNTPHTAMAVYEWRLEGDNNGDDQVDLLDLIYVRDKLYTRCGE